MKVQKVKFWYNELVESGDLQKMFPSLTGTWSKDKEEFIEIYKDFSIDANPIDNINSIYDLDLNDDDFES